jgi:hypothetical protein
MDADHYRSASHQAAFAHLAGPMRAGARTQVLALDASGHAHADGPLRDPMLLAVCRGALGAQGLTLTVTLGGSAPGLPGGPVKLVFAPWTEAGASLPVWALAPGHVAAAACPGIDAAVAITQGPSGAAASGLVELHVVEGLLGRVLFACGAEKQRLRRQACEIAAARVLAGATSGALDRYGADLGVPRFTDALAWNAAAGAPASLPGREADAAYRRRLALFRPLRMSTVNALRSLTGSGPEPGALAGLGFDAALDIAETNAEVAVAVRLLSSGPQADFARRKFLRFVRATYLVKPGAQLPTWSLLPPREKTAINAMLARLPGAFDFPAEAYLSRYLAEALDRLGRVRALLGATTRWRVLRAQDDAGGSRFELGLGVEMSALPAPELDALGQRARTKQFAGTPDYRMQVLLEALQPRPSAEDPEGRWLLAPCGLRSAHVTAAGLYVSHLPIHALQIEVTPGTPLALRARLNAPGDGPVDSRLFHALRAARATAAGAGVPAFLALANADAPTAWAHAVPTVTAAFSRAGLRGLAAADEVARTVAGLADVPAESMATLRLDGSMAAGLLANTDAAVAQLRALVAALRGAEIGSVLPMTTDAGAVLLVVTVGDAPPPAMSLNSSAPGFAWYALKLRGEAGGLTGKAGARNGYFLPATQSLNAVVVATLVRADREDPRNCIPPYQVRVDAPAGVTLDLAQFEFLMNLLRQAQPLGVVIDTQPVRSAHVAPAGSGTPVALTGRISHAWREFRQRRSVGVIDPANLE